MLSILHSQNLPGFVAEVSGRVSAQTRLLDVEPGPLNTETNMTENREKQEKKNKLMSLRQTLKIIISF